MEGTVNIAHRTHVLPRTYLKRFKSSPGKIWRFDERRSDWREVSLKKQAGVVPDFYPDHVEKWLATNIEQPAADGLQKLASAEPPQVEIAKEARLSLSYYLAVQLYRTPAALEERWGPAVSATIDKHKEKRGQNELIDRLEALLHQLDPDSEKAGFAIPLALDGKVFKQAVDRVARDVFTFTWRVGGGTGKCPTRSGGCPGRAENTGRRAAVSPVRSLQSQDSGLRQHRHLRLRINLPADRCDRDPGWRRKEVQQ